MPNHQSPNRHLYRNALFARLCLPFRFMALVQVDVTDLKPAWLVGGHMEAGAAMAGGQQVGDLLFLPFVCVYVHPGLN